MKIAYKEKELEIENPVMVKELFANEIANSKYNVMGCLVNNE